MYLFILSMYNNVSVNVCLSDNLWIWCIKGAGAPFQLIYQIYCARNFWYEFSRHFLLSTLILLYLSRCSPNTVF